MKKLNFGCGRDIKEGWDNCDIQKNKDIIYCCADVFPYPFKDNVYDCILLNYCLCYFERMDKVLFELWRIAKPNAIIEINDAYFNNKGASTDIQTKHYITDFTFKAFVNEPCIVNKKKMFQIVKLKLIPTWVGRFMPKSLREKLSVFWGGLISQIHIKLRVLK